MYPKSSLSRTILAQIVKNTLDLIYTDDDSIDAAPIDKDELVKEHGKAKEEGTKNTVVSHRSRIYWLS